MRQGAGDLEYVTSKPSLPRKIALGIGRRLRLRLLPGGVKLRRKPFGIWRGLRFETNLHGYAYQFLGLYEREIHRHVRRLAPPGARTFDIGAADGRYAIALARQTGAAVIAFEPDADALAGLAMHREANPPFGAQVTVVEEPVGDGLSLDDAAERFGAPAFVLIDVEGAEMAVLRSGETLLKERRPALVIEVHTADLERECVALLEAAGYETTVVRRRRWLREDRPLAHNRWLVAQ